MNFLKIVNLHKQYLIDTPIENIDKKYIDKIIHYLNKDNIVILSGLKGIGKTKLISYLIKNSNYKNNFFYFNKELDSEQNIQTIDNLNKIIKLYEEKNEIKIIILENIAVIKDIKKFIKEFYKNGYKIVIIGNNIKIEDKTIIEVFDKIKTNFKYLGDEKEENKNLNFLKKQEIIKTKYILFCDVLKIYSLKHFSLYEYILSKIAKNNYNTSIRNLHKELDKDFHFSYITLADFITFLNNAYILKSINLFDFKRNKIIDTKNKFFFTSIDFRNSLFNFNVKENILKENFLYLELLKRGYKIYFGKNGDYEFSFVAFKKNKVYYIDFYNKNENKLLSEKILELERIPNIKNKQIERIIITDLNNREESKETIYGILKITNLSIFLRKVGKSIKIK